METAKLKTLEIPVQMDNLSSSLDKLGHVIGELGSRLAPISGSSSVPQSTDTASVPSCELGLSLFQAVSAINTLEDKITSMLIALEI